MLGMRRGEVLGLRWSDVDLAATVTIRNNRVVAGGTVVDGTPKSKASRRTLRLDGLPEVLRLLRQGQAQQRLERPEGLAWTPGDYVVVDPLGRPMRPETYSERFTDLATAPGLPVIRLHDVRPPP